MATVSPIRTEADYEAALARIAALMEAAPGSPEEEELDVLADLVEHYEAKHVPMGHPTPLEAIRFRMEQQGLEPRDLAPLLGSRSRVSEVLSGKRPLTLDMARALHEHLGIPAEVLLRGSDREGRTRPLRVEAFPVREMMKLGFIERVRGGASSSKKVLQSLEDLVERAGGWEACAALYRKSEHSRRNSKSDADALAAWCCQVLATAGERPPPGRYRRGTVSPAFLREVAQLSPRANGPREVKDFLAAKGISFVVVPHLSRTYLDGAALRAAGRPPVVALTLRHDRIDNFWFTLLHELAHVGRHLDGDEPVSFFDDLDLPGTDPVEHEADEWAVEALVPAALWEGSAARESPTPANVLALAHEAGVHPAIVAGKIRYEQRNYRLLSQFVGSGQVRHHFPEWSRGAKPRTRRA